ncbi:uncharacterized protein LOC115256118 [Aedes albopictus]|uniref:Secreted protein n=1 Tax=Aedes albopictus TaxID=7160 RepID=A0ABM1ZBI0_AEDAL|nr:uncharacterized protein LOC115256118 [Aedes albopictus]
MKSILVLSIVIYMMIRSSNCDPDTETHSNIKQEKIKSIAPAIDGAKIGAGWPQISSPKENDKIRMPNPIMGIAKPGSNMEAGGAFGGVKSGCTGKPVRGSQPPMMPIKASGASFGGLSANHGSIIKMTMKPPMGVISEVKH